MSKKIKSILATAKNQMAERTGPSRIPQLLDDDGVAVKEGDRVSFSYGIPPMRVEGPVIELDGILWVKTPEHQPTSCRLDQLREFVGGFFKVQPS